MKREHTSTKRYCWLTGSWHITHFELNVNLSFPDEDVLSEASTVEEVIFKFNRSDLETRITLQDNAFFYDGFKDSCDKPELLGLRSKGDSRLHSKPGLKSFEKHLASHPPGVIHVLVDRNPSVQILFTTNVWSRLYSLTKAIKEDDGRQAVVMKGG